MSPYDFYDAVLEKSIFLSHLDFLYDDFVIIVHKEINKLMIQCLEPLGYEEGCRIFESMVKEYFYKRRKTIKKNEEVYGMEMTPEEFKEEMGKIKARLEDPDDKYVDIEMAHRLADILMMRLLVSLGYRNGIIEFENMDKCY